MRCYLIISLFLVSSLALAQSVATNSEQQLENQTEVNEVETEDDSYSQVLSEFRKYPLNLNTASEDELKELHLLSTLQIQNLIRYRKILGLFLNIYELQAIPTWDVGTIQKILPYVTVKQSVNFVQQIGKRFRNGNRTLLARITYVPEKAKGFNNKNSDSSASFYSGGREKLLVRYKYHYKNLLQYGLLGEKDAGEQFFKGNQKQGFDFYSIHLFARNLGVIKTLALGDFTVNLGQGLIQWQSLAFKKSADVLNIKRQAVILNPYNSSGENNFHRGIGATFQKNKWEATFFISYRKLDANIILDTTLGKNFVTFFLTSGYHRTVSEIADKGALKQWASGGNITYKDSKWRVSANAIQYNFDVPVKKGNQPYQNFNITGKNLANVSVDYSYTWRNVHFFGETAQDNKYHVATVNGLLVSIDPKADLALLYRNISKKYQSLNANAFTENVFPENEKGLYAGFALRPTPAIRIDAYTDLFSFPFLKFRVDAPSSGKDYLIQLLYKPNKQVEIYTRYRNESKQENYNSDNMVTSAISFTSRQSWRTQFFYQLDLNFSLRSRFETVRYNKKDLQKEQGFLTFFDLIYNSFSSPFSITTRLQYFENEGYNSRIYAYENDVLYSFSIPAFVDKGWRTYFIVQYNFTKKLQAWLRVAQTTYRDKLLIGSGLDEIKGNRRTEIKTQILYSF
ncbi:MAG TPA: helix-hairpin-helix domain-containing protein [Chitinophagaceae bacterium]|nr:helix-hairpin-helix domain-containing protein [Chitinophagaceae bacterium]